MALIKISKMIAMNGHGDRHETAFATRIMIYFTGMAVRAKRPSAVAIPTSKSTAKSSVLALLITGVTTANVIALIAVVGFWSILVVGAIRPWPGMSLRILQWVSLAVIVAFGIQWFGFSPHG